MNLGFTFAGIVESNLDPMKLGRLKVRVPAVYGTASTGAGYIGTDNLPWALPAGMPAGGSAMSGGFSHLPERGDKVWVRFLDGEPEKPIWEWGMQSAGDAQKLKLHSYDIGTPVGKPNRALWTRYSHAFEMGEGALIATTSQGYRIVMTDATAPGANDGNIMVSTPKGNFVMFDDLDDSAKLVVMQDVYINAGDAVTGLSDSFSWHTMTGAFEVSSGGGIRFTTAKDVEITTAKNVVIDALGNTDITTVGAMNVGFTTLNLGLAATEPAVLGNLLTAWIYSLYTWLAVHTHTSATPGSPTSPPQQPVAVIQPLPNLLLSETVKIQN